MVCTQSFATLHLAILHLMWRSTTVFVDSRAAPKTIAG